MTKPVERMERAVVSPMPPGHWVCVGSIWAKRVWVEPRNFTMVVPVPWMFAALLKLLTRMSPVWSGPWLFVTMATP